jgi:hypothetical protein
MKFKMAKVLTLIILTTFLTSIFTLSPTAATSTPRIYLEPSNNIYTTDTAYVGFQFNITVWVENAVNIGGVQIYLEFNDDILRVTRWFEPKTDPQYIFYGRSTSALPTPPDPGYVHVSSGTGYVETSISLFPPNPPYFTGNGKICIYEFNVTAVPPTPGKYTSNLIIDTIDTYLLDGETGDEVQGVIKENGYYEISRPGPKYSLTISATSGGTTDPIPGVHIYDSGTVVSVAALPAANYAFDHWELDTVNIGSDNPVDVTMDANHALHAAFVFSPPEGSRIFVDPFEIIDPQAVPCQTIFSINVSIDDIADMKTCEFNLTYNTNIISVIGLNFLSVNGHYPFLSLIANDSAGFIWVRLLYSTGITVSNPAPLVTITFHVDSLGVSPLNLNDTEITDSSGNPIPHDVYHGIYIAVIRDVAITNIVLSRNWAYPGWQVNITVTAKNKGNVSETFDVYAYFDSTVIGIETVTDLPPNEERDIIFEWDTSGLSEGNYTIKAEAQQVPYELNTGDNILVDGKVWIMTHFHDVAIVDVVSESWVYVGWTAHINVTAQNMGEYTESFDINAYYDSTLIGTIHVLNLAPGSYYEAHFDLNTSTLLPCHNYTITGEATLVPYEYNETNNILIGPSLKVRFIGDLNGDGKVDLKDVYIVSLAFGSYPGHPKWNPMADLNGDNKVDLKDVYLVTKNYGKTCSP